MRRERRGVQRAGAPTGGAGDRLPEPSTALRFPEGDLPAGATRVRLCPGPPLTNYDGTAAFVDVQGPADLLTSGVDELVTLVNDQADADGDLVCSSDGGPEVAYWFGYGDGDWRAVQHGSYGCDVLRVGHRNRRLGGADLALAFTEALLAQRAEADPPDTTPAVRCLAPHHTPRTALARADLDVASALRCVSTRPGTVRTATLPAELVAQVNAELWPGVTQRSRQACWTGSGEWIEGVTAWGDLVAWAIDPCGRLYALHGGSLYRTTAGTSRRSSTRPWPRCRWAPRSASTEGPRSPLDPDAAHNSGSSRPPPWFHARPRPGRRPHCLRCADHRRRGARGR